jgi:hypothetical protein
MVLSDPYGTRIRGSFTPRTPLKDITIFELLMRIRFSKSIGAPAYQQAVFVEPNQSLRKARKTK